jgi:beta-phosphoglucomutase-like phosphatase (HAD superfamily)
MLGSGRQVGVEAAKAAGFAVVVAVEMGVEKAVGARWLG